MYNSFMSASPTPKDNESARFHRSIRAAEELFKRIGFRAVTMELVAREAQVAKATLYSYFKNKDELFVVVCERMARLLRAAVEHALTQLDAPLDTRLSQAVIAKHRLVFTFVRGSAHSAELFSSKDAMAGGIFRELDAAILRLLADAMAKDPQLSPNAGRLARALYFGSAELASRCATAADMETELSAFASMHLTGARALARQE
jgi:AcrR family transcriptional regulator